MIFKIKIKDGVMFKELNIYTITIIRAILDCWPLRYPAPVITSARDGKHKIKSLHYEDMALDFRTYDMKSKELSIFIHDLKQFLSDSVYDIVLEKDHLHIEADLKNV